MQFGNLNWLLSSPSLGFEALSLVRRHACNASAFNEAMWGTNSALPHGKCERGLIRHYTWRWAGRSVLDRELLGRGFRVRVWNLNRGEQGMDWVPLLDQYLMREMVPVLALALGVCATLGMPLGALAGLVREVAGSGLPLGVAGAAAMLQLPYFAGVSMPTVCLAASLSGLGRLELDMESVALFAAGVPLWRMLLAPLCLCLVGAALKLACHNYLVPYGSSQGRKMVETALTTHMQGLRQSEDLIYQEYGTSEEMGEDGKRIPSYGLQRIWYAGKMEGACLAGLVLLEVLPSGYVRRVINHPAMITTIMVPLFHEKKIFFKKHSPQSQNSS